MHKAIEEKTKFSRSLHTNTLTAETITTVNGQQYEISTAKRHSGKLISIAMPVTATEDDNGTVITSFSLFSDTEKKITLISEKVGRVTEKAVKEQHNKALILFDDMVEDGIIQPEKKQEPEIGTIIFLDGYGKTKGSDNNKHVVYNIRQTSFGVKYDTVELDSLKLESQEYIKPFSEKFGIGSYFEPEYKYTGSQDDLNNLVIEAHEKKKAQDESENIQREEAKKERARKIEEGKKLVNIPSWAKCVIVADMYEDNSDGMTDYFATSKTQRVYLAFSRTTRNNMKELREACVNFEETKHFATEADENTGFDYEKAVEYTDGHSYLPDYYLGTKQWFGYKVTKEKYFDVTNEEHLEKLYIAAADGLYLIPEQKEATTEPNYNKVEVSDGEIKIVDYSERAIAVIGDTKPIKDKLKALGGRFNFRLSCGAGWIFPKTKLEEVQNLFS